jgi:hypothetical protein
MAAARMRAVEFHCKPSSGPLGGIDQVDDARKAIGEFNGMNIDGRELLVNEPRPQESRGGGGRFGGGGRGFSGGRSGPGDAEVTGCPCTMA